jgi:hypothetical protein
MDRDPGICRLYALAGSGSLIADSDDLAAFQVAQIAHDIWSPIAVTDNAKPKHKNSPSETGGYEIALLFVGNFAN